MRCSIVRSTAGALRRAQALTPSAPPYTMSDSNPQNVRAMNILITDKFSLITDQPGTNNQQLATSN